MFGSERLEIFKRTHYGGPFFASLSPMAASPLDKILTSKRLGFVAEHGSKLRPVK